MNRFDNIARVARKHRLNKDISQADLSKALGYKNGQFISNVERGLCSIPLKQLKKFCEVTGATHAEIKDAMVADFASDIDLCLMPTEAQPSEQTTTT